MTAAPRTLRVVVACALAGGACVAACGPVRAPGGAPRGPSAGRRGLDGGDHVVATLRAEPFREVRVGGDEDPPTNAGGVLAAHGDGGRLGLPADAGVEASEVAWLLAHLGDDPERANPSDTPAVRALASRGATGVRAVARVFSRPDAARVPFARRVVERVVARSCRRRPREDAARTIYWIELGGVPPGALEDAGASAWSYAADRAWPRAALERLEAWASSGLPCDPSAGDAGSAQGDTGAGDAGAGGADDAGALPGPRVDG